MVYAAKGGPGMAASSGCLSNYRGPTTTKPYRGSLPARRLARDQTSRTRYAPSKLEGLTQSNFPKYGNNSLVPYRMSSLPTYGGKLTSKPYAVEKSKPGYGIKRKAETKPAKYNGKPKTMDKPITYYDPAKTKPAKEKETSIPNYKSTTKPASYNATTPKQTLAKAYNANPLYMYKPKSGKAPSKYETKPKVQTNTKRNLNQLSQLEKISQSYDSPDVVEVLSDGQNPFPSTTSYHPAMLGNVEIIIAVSGMAQTPFSITYGRTQTADGTFSEFFNVSYGGITNIPSTFYKDEEERRLQNESSRKNIIQQELDELLSGQTTKYEENMDKLMKYEQKLLDDGSQHERMIFNADDFITSKTRFIGEAEEIMNYVKEAFRLTTGKDLPNNFSLSLLNKKELKKAHEFFSEKWQEGIEGFCINKNGFGQSKIFVKKDELAKVMLTIGHELGHLQTASLNGVEEEAKAFAFSIEWMNKIKDNDVAGLKYAIVTEKPAENGLHNVAFNFVNKLLHQGMSAMNVFHKLTNGLKYAT